MANKEIRLVNVDKPNLYRDTFPYSAFPKAVFDHQRIDYDIPEKVWITDTTFRDGQQARPPYLPEQILRVYDLLHEIDGGTGLIRQCEFFLYSEKDRKAVELCKERGYEYPEITGWIRAVAADFKLVSQMGLRETGILTSASDYHIFLKLLKTREQAMSGYLDIVKAALDSGVLPRCHFEDITRADYDGFVLPFASALLKISDDYKQPVKIRLCDTLGFGLPWPGVAVPRSVPKLIHGLRKVGVPSERLEWHGHNDFHKVHTNGMTAWLYGCDVVNTTLFGFGERTGNPPLEGAILEYIAIKGDLCGIDTMAITELTEYMKSIGLPIPDNYPFVGKHFNTTRAGIHADGLRRDEQIYNIFDTEKLLGRPPRVAITDKSGADGVAHWVNEFLGLKGKDKINKIKIHKLARWVIDQYDEHGRLTAISDQELEQQTKELLPEYWEKYKRNKK